MTDTTSSTKSTGGECCSSKTHSSTRLALVVASSSSSQTTPPRVIHVHPDPAPYAQLCVRCVGEKQNIYAMMIGKQQQPGHEWPATSFQMYARLTEDEEGDEDEKFPDLGQVSSSQSSETHDEESEHWASTGWDDLRATLSFTSSNNSGSCGSSSTLASSGSASSQDDDGGLIPQQGIIWLDEQWLGMNVGSFADGDAWLLGDDIAGDDRSDSFSWKTEHVAACFESWLPARKSPAGASACGRPGKSSLRRRRKNDRVSVPASVTRSCHRRGPCYTCRLMGALCLSVRNVQLIDIPGIQSNRQIGLARNPFFDSSFGVVYIRDNDREHWRIETVAGTVGWESRPVSSQKAAAIARKIVPQYIPGIHIRSPYCTYCRSAVSLHWVNR